MPYNKTLVVVASFLGGRNSLTHFFADSVFRPIFRLLLCQRSLSVYCRSHAGYGSSKKAIGMAMLTFCLERNSWEWIYEEKLCSMYLLQKLKLPDPYFFFLHESSNESQHYSLWSGPLNLYHK